MELELTLDSNLSEAEAKSQNPLLLCPAEILARQTVLKVSYWSFDGAMHEGRLVLDERLVPDMQKVFEAMDKEKFPLQSVIPAADPRFKWDDDALMDKNNTSAFNYRVIAGTDKMSLHALGQAIDINPRTNPFYSASGAVYPKGATYDPLQPGTITADSFLVALFEELGWTWGGRWSDRKDWQHFEKSL
jgi:peptidoglycan L-alanyl-D-glutamate endopeptidase CwlK